jgi:hypothetical protein
MNDHKIYPSRFVKNDINNRGCKLGFLTLYLLFLREKYSFKIGTDLILYISEAYQAPVMNERLDWVRISKLLIQKL